MGKVYADLNPDKALVWRIMHRENFGWTLENGLYSANSTNKSYNWVGIGNQDLIGRRGRYRVPVSPGGVLNDYVPFYFTPFSPMLYNIHTGIGGVPRVDNKDIIILVSSLRRVAEAGCQFVLTDQHACSATAHYYNSLDNLRAVDWSILQQRDFSRDMDDPEKLLRYQAEALVHEYMPVKCLVGVICYTDSIRKELDKDVQTTGNQLQVVCRPGWYF